MLRPLGTVLARVGGSWSAGHRLHVLIIALTFLGSMSVGATLAGFESSRHFGSGGPIGLRSDDKTLPVEYAYDWANPFPSARSDHEMAYDSESDRVILFGGSGSNETWAYDYNTNEWALLDPPTGPSARRARDGP